MGGGRLSGTAEIMEKWNNKNLVLQDLKNCDHRGRDCIEKNAILSFNCSVTCEGIYADVQWTEDHIGYALEEQEVEMDQSVGKDLPKEIYQRLINLEKKMKLSNVEKGEEMDKEKFKMLIKEYKEFKLNNTRHFGFSSAANSTNFGIT